MSIRTLTTIPSRRSAAKSVSTFSTTGATWSEGPFVPVLQRTRLASSPLLLRDARHAYPDLSQIAVGHMVAPPPRPSEKTGTVPSALDDVIAIGLAKKPAQRYPTAIEMASAARELVSRSSGPLAKAAPPP